MRARAGNVHLRYDLRRFSALLHKLRQPKVSARDYLPSAQGYVNDIPLAQRNVVEVRIRDSGGCYFDFD